MFDCISNTFQFWLSKKSYKRRKRDTEKKEKAIGLSVDQGFASRNYETDIIKEEAEKLGYEVYELIAGGNAEAQNSQIERLLEKNISALLVCAVDRNKIESALLQAKAKGVPVIAFDRLIVRAKPCLPLWSFSLIRKTELWKQINHLLCR